MVLRRVQVTSIILSRIELEPLRHPLLARLHIPLHIRIIMDSACCRTDPDVRV